MSEEQNGVQYLEKGVTPTLCCQTNWLFSKSLDPMGTKLMKKPKHTWKWFCKI